MTSLTTFTGTESIDSFIEHQGDALLITPEPTVVFKYIHNKAQERKLLSSTLKSIMASNIKRENVSRSHKYIIKEVIA